MIVMTKTLTELVVLAGETNEKNGYNGYSKARADGYGLHYLALKDLLEVSENCEALDEVRTGHGPDEIYESWPPTPPSLAVEFASGADATEHFRANTKPKLEGYLIEKLDAVIRNFGTIYEIAREHNLSVPEVMAYLERKIEYNAQRADTAKSGVKKF